MSDIFLSYARADLPRVKQIVDALAARGWSVWWDRTIIPGQIFARVIQAALDEARCVIVLWSRNSVESDWVQTEADEGQRRGVLIPALLDDVVIPLAFRRIQAASLVSWSGKLPYPAFEELARAVERLLAASVPQLARALAATAPDSVIQPDAPARLIAGQTRENPVDGLTYVWIPPGKFMMGCSPVDDECFEREKPAHEVTITTGFWLGQTPVTQEAYQRVIGKNPSNFTGSQLPVDRVTWNEAQAYCEAIGMRLPTEAEWEYAARAGSVAARYGDLNEIAWYNSNSKSTTHKVGRQQPNAWKLHDMLGNVWEWMADWYEERYYGRSPAADPPGPASGESRVLRGGSWDSEPKYVRVSTRTRRVGWASRDSNIGFRCTGELR